MNTKTPQTPGDGHEEIAALIETLHLTGQRLERLTGGEVDSVSNRDGQTFLLQHAQDQLRLSESASQVAILNALPASIALLDSQGNILSVNEAWQKFGRANGTHNPGHDVGVNYLKVCDEARGDDAAEASQAAAGIRAVLRGKIDTFACEYPCHSPAERRWFQMTATPLAGTSKSVVVMHLNITANKLAENALRESEQEFHTLSEAMPQIVWVTRADGWNIYFNQHWVDYTGLTLAESLGHGWNKSFHPDDQQHAWDAWQNATAGNGIYSIEIRLRRADGAYRWWLVRGVPSLGADGSILKWFGTCTDIHEMKLAGLEISRANAELRESERRFTDMLGNVELISMMLDREARLTYCNDYLLQLTGWKREEVIGNSWWDIFVTPEEQHLRGKFFSALLDNLPEVLHHENEIVTRAGEHRLIHWNNSVLRSGTGDVIGIASIGEDITDRRNAEAGIKYLNRVLSMLSGINTLIVRVNDRDELLRGACDIALAEGGFRMAMLVIVDQSTMLPVSISSAGKDDDLQANISDIMSSSDSMQKTLVAQAIRENRAVIANDVQSDSRLLFGKQYVEAGVRSMTVMPLSSSGKTRGAFALYASETNFFQSDEMKLLTEVTDDIAYALEHLDKQERLNYLAYYDELTGLANRALFLERVALHMRSAGSGGHELAIGLVDLERFKNIDDSLGRAAGDALLKLVAEWLAQFARDPKLLARIDADHFAFVIPEVEPEGNLSALFDKIAKAFQVYPFRVNNTELRLAAKAGIALFPDDGDNADTLFRNAEAALKTAKVSGERFLFYKTAMNEAVAVKFALENQLRRAIDNEEFVLHYQPKVNLVSGKVTGAEALIRWNDPRTGLVPPGLFIPLLEETGMIYEVGRWALHKAIEDSMRWRTAGLASVRIAVNVSPLQLRNVNFIDEVRQAIARDPHAGGLELELTESVIMNNIEFNITTLQALRDMGVTIAIDDFGTGFSSLSYLAKLPVDTLKIDRAFVIAMTAGPEGLSLVSTIVNLAHAFKLKAVAESVETDEQMRLLRLLGCDEMQGFLFSKPVPAEIFEAKFLVPLTPGDNP